MKHSAIFLTSEINSVNKLVNFLYPVYLYFIAGIIVPILIHLWNVRRGKTLKVGSILLLAESSKQQAHSFRLHNWLLLILRCLIIMFFTLLLAEPVLTKNTSSSQSPGWIVAEKSSFKEAYKMYPKTIDSLVNSGYEMHDAVAGYPTFDISDTTADDSNDINWKPTNFWALLSDLNQRLPKDFPVLFLFPEYTNRFAGHRPGSGIKSEWLGYSLPSTDSTWIQNAYTYNDSIHIVSVNSNDSLIRYTTSAIASDQPTTGSISIDIRDGNLYVEELNNERTNSILVDTHAVRITIYSKPADPAAKYISAALEAIRAYSKQKIQVELFTDSSKIPLLGDWIFWLKEDSLPAKINYKHRLVLKQGTIDSGISWLKAPGMQINIIRPPSITKLVRSAASLTQGQHLWVDGYGNPILTKFADTSYVLYQLYIKPEPRWTSLPWHEQFPELLLKLIFKESNAGLVTPNTMRIDTAQIQPDSKSVVNFETKINSRNSNIKRWIWVILFLLFAGERMISFRKHVANKI